MKRGQFLRVIRDGIDGPPPPPPPPPAGTSATLVLNDSGRTGFNYLIRMM